MSIISNNVLQAMNGTSSTSGATSTNDTSATTPVDPNSPAALQSNFMTMLIAQMQYQDPTQPMDSSQMTSQLAQIDSVQGISQLNATMSSMVSAMQSSQTFQAASLVGKQVVVPSGTVSIASGTSPNIGVQLPSSADSVQVSIVRNGQSIKSFNLGTQAAGNIPITWDGTDSNGVKVPDGTYVMQVQASLAGKVINASGLSTATVQSISSGSNGVLLNLNNNSSVSPSSVAQIF